MKKYLFEEKDEKNRTVRSPVPAVLVEDIFEWINKEIETQKEFLKKQPQNKKSIEWRIIGMQLLKKDLEE